MRRFEPDGAKAPVCWEGGHCEDVVVLARYTADGSPDALFGDGGTVTSDFKGWINAIAVQSDSKIVGAAGAVGRFALVRYNTDGSPDTTFGGDGRVSVFPSSEARTVAIQPDGKIVAAGPVFSVARCLSA